MVLKERAEVRGDQIGMIEAQMQISSDRSGKTIEQNISINTLITHENWSDQPFWILCGLLANDDGPASFFEVSGPFVEYIHVGSDAKYDTWYTFRVSINPENMAISCYRSGILLGTKYPSRPDILGESQFEVRIHAWRPPGSYGTTFVDNVRISQ
jgi:hypothetical protein